MEQSLEQLHVVDASSFHGDSCSPDIPKKANEHEPSKSSRVTRFVHRAEETSELCNGCRSQWQRTRITRQFGVLLSRQDERIFSCHLCKSHSNDINICWSYRSGTQSNFQCYPSLNKLCRSVIDLFFSNRKSQSSVCLESNSQWRGNVQSTLHFPCDQRCWQRLSICWQMTYPFQCRRTGRPDSRGENEFLRTDFSKSCHLLDPSIVESLHNQSHPTS